MRTQTRLARRSATDLRAIRRAARHIGDLNVTLDRQLSTEQRDELRMEHLRQAAGQITRAANDAVQAYRRVSVALKDEAAMADPDPAEIERTRRQLADARTAMLAALETASQRYPWTAWEPDAD